MAQDSNAVPGWLLLLTFLILITLLAIFGDLFTFITGTLILGLVFASGYNHIHTREH